jgi:hypothetical protein
VVVLVWVGQVVPVLVIVFSAWTDQPDPHLTGSGHQTAT